MFVEACYKFLEHLRTVKNASEHTTRNYTIDLNALKTYMEDELFPHLQPEDRPQKIQYQQSLAERFKGKDTLLDIKQIDKKLVRRFLADLKERKQSPSTIVRRLSSLRTFFRYCVGQAIVSESPVSTLESPKVEKRIPVSLSYDQVKKLFDQPDTTNFLGFRDRAILELFYSSGLRVSELVALNRSDIDTEGLTVRVRGKGKKERVIPITKNAATWIQAYVNHPERHRDFEGHQAQQDPEAVFLNKLGTRLTARSVDRNFEKYLKASGLAGKVTPHTIRHTIATHWLEKGMDLKTIQVILGHRSIAATTVYTKVSPKLKKEVYDDAHPRA